MKIEKIKAKDAASYVVPLYWLTEGETIICMCDDKKTAERIKKTLSTAGDYDDDQ